MPTTERRTYSARCRRLCGALARRVAGCCGCLAQTAVTVHAVLALSVAATQAVLAHPTLVSRHLDDPAQAQHDLRRWQMALVLPWVFVGAAWAALMVVCRCCALLWAALGCLCGALRSRGKPCRRGAAAVSFRDPAPAPPGPDAPPRLVARKQARDTSHLTRRRYAAVRG